MDREAYNVFCGSLPATSHVVQWGGADVWKVGAGPARPKHNKVFAIATWGAGKHAGITFKVSDIAYQVLRDMPGLRPAPYLASRGMSWIQHYAEPGLDDAALRDHLTEAHRLVSRNLPKTLREDLGLPPNR